MRSRTAGTFAEPRELAEGDDGSREGHGADEGADEQLDAVAGWNRVRDAERGGIVHHGDGDEHGGEADERVHRRDQLRHLRHLHAMRDEPADDAADRERAEGDVDTLGDREGRQDGERHARDAEAVAASSREWMERPLRARMKSTLATRYEQGDLVGGHGVTESSLRGLSS